MKCTNKQWSTCQVEKMGCDGCYYTDEIYEKYNKKETDNEQEISECTESKSNQTD